MLSCCGQSLKVIDTSLLLSQSDKNLSPSNTLVHELSLNESFVSLSWKPDNSCIISSCKTSGRYIVYDLASRNFDSYEEEGCECCQYSTSGKTIATISNNPKCVNIRDSRSGSLKKQFKVDSTSGVSRCLTWIHNLPCVAVGNNLGRVTVYNPATSVSSSPLTFATNEVGSLNCLRCNYAPKPVLASGSVSGNITLWDVNSSSSVYSFAVHKGSAVDLSFSPLSDDLLISVGTDAKMVLMDMRQKKAVKSFTLDSYACAVDFYETGQCVAFAQLPGSISFSDLRSIKGKPFHTLSLDENNITSLRFQSFDVKLSRSPLVQKAVRTSRTRPHSGKQKLTPSRTTFSDSGKDLDSFTNSRINSPALSESSGVASEKTTNSYEVPFRLTNNVKLGNNLDVLMQNNCSGPIKHFADAAVNTDEVFPRRDDLKCLNCLSLQKDLELDLMQVQMEFIKQIHGLKVEVRSELKELKNELLDLSNYIKRNDFYS